jgi:simple sugar transport system ATP-binding protein
MTGRLQVEHVTKRFGNVVALQDVSADFAPGEIHAVLGENGAGKSTLMHVLAGFLAPQEGHVTLDGAALPLGRPHLCREMGIEMVHQHFTLVPEFTVAENVALARLPSLASRLDLITLTAHAFEHAKELGWELDPRALVRDLPVGVQQRVEILKCLSGDAKVLIFDEPTAVLSPAEIEDLFRVLRQLRDQGKIVILIAHKLSEVMGVADRVTVLRKGIKVASAEIEDVDERQLAEWMVGELPDFKVAKGKTPLREALRAENLKILGDRGELAVKEVSLAVNAGEILGIGGVDGNGQVELAEALALVRRAQSGSLIWNGSALKDSRVALAYIPQDRQEDGLALSMSVQDNLLIEGHRRPSLTRGPILLFRQIRAWVLDLIKRFDIVVENPDVEVANLSGGNQQKVVVSRNLDRRPDLLIAVNPTRGLDLKATRFVHEQILLARDGGSAVALFSTDLDELAAVADRTVFMSRGKIVEGEGPEALLGGRA